MLKKIRFLQRNDLFKNEKGFTLIELLIVIAIIGIIAGIAIPNFMGMIGRAEERADQATAETIKNAVRFYYAEEGDWPISVRGTFLPLDDSEFIENNEHKLKPYLEDPNPTPAQNPGWSFCVRIEPDGTVLVEAMGD